MGKPFANGMMHGRLGGVFSCSDLQLRQSTNYVRKNTPPLRGRELRQCFFQQPFQFHALQRLVRLFRQIQRLRLDAVIGVQRVERPVVADVLRVVDLKPLIFFEKRSYFNGNCR